MNIRNLERKKYDMYSSTPPRHFSPFYFFVTSRSAPSSAYYCTRMHRRAALAGVATAGEVAHPSRGDVHRGSDGRGGGWRAPARGALARD